jgi:hypothetical protein
MHPVHPVQSSGNWLEGAAAGCVCAWENQSNSQSWYHKFIALALSATPCTVRGAAKKLFFRLLRHE